MKFIISIFLLASSALYAQKAPFASQSDLVADLSDSVLNGIYHHRLGFCGCESTCERSVWVEGFGDYRGRDSSRERNDYDHYMGGFLVGIDYALSCDTHLNFFAGGSWGAIDICDESNFDTSSILFGMTVERFCNRSFYGFAILGGFLEEERHFNNVHEKPQGVFLSPELTYSYQFDCLSHPVFSGSLRYAGFFSRDYQHRETLGTLYVKDRSIQLITLRGECAIPLCTSCLYLEPYLGVAGRFQLDGHHVRGRLILAHQHFSDGLDSVIGYGLIGLRGSRQYGCFDLQANVEASYDSDCSWRVIGDISLNYQF